MQFKNNKTIEMQCRHINQVGRVVTDWFDIFLRIVHCVRFPVVFLSFTFLFCTLYAVNFAVSHFTFAWTYKMRSAELQNKKTCSLNCCLSRD